MKYFYSTTLLFCLYCWISPVVSQAQTTNIINLNLQDFAEKVNMINLGKSTPRDGEFFLNKEWTEGAVYLKEQPPIENTKLRYFVYGKAMQITHNKDTLILRRSTQLDSLRIGSSLFIFTTYTHGKAKYKQDYFHKLTNTKLSLLKHYRCKFEKNTSKASSGYQKVQPDRYTLESEYFIQLVNLPARRFKVSKKEILKLFANKKNEMQKFIKKGQLRIHKEEDLVKIFNYYNKLF